MPTAEEFPDDAINNAARKVIGAEENPAQDRWWENDSVLKRRIVSPLREVFSATSLDKRTAVLNYSDENLSDEELRQISEAISAVAVLTGGKIFDRMQGIILAPRETFPRDDDKPLGPSEELAGYADFYWRRIFINMDAMRKPIVSQGEARRSFTKEHFPHYKPTRLQYYLAHEAAHLMDLNYLSEIKRHGIDTERAGHLWRGSRTVGEDVIVHNFAAFEDPDPSVYLEERSITARSLHSALEEFAEVFAISAFGGGDISSVPRKYQRMAETMRLAKGQAVIGPHKVELKKIFTRL